jgi:hypothetical protein
LVSFLEQNVQRRLGKATCDNGGNRVEGTQCLNVTGGGGSCTANDVAIASVSLVSILGDSCQSQDGNVTFLADYTVETNADRFDSGLWFNLKGGNAQFDNDPNACTVLTGPIGVNIF